MEKASLGNLSREGAFELVLVGSVGACKVNESGRAEALTAGSGGSWLGLFIYFKHLTALIN